METLEKLRRDIGSFNFAAQYQQSPTTPDGQIFLRKYFELVEERPPFRKQGELFLTIDSASSTSSTADYTAITVVWIHDGRLWVLKVDRGRWDYEALKARTLAWIKYLSRPIGRLSVVVENAASGIALGQYLRDRPDDSFQSFTFQPQEKKLARAMRVLPDFEAGIRVLNRPGNSAEVERFLNEFMSFPNGPNDDQVDSLVQLLHWRRVRLLLHNPKTDWTKF